ncbi:MAG: hypothetical protein ACR2GU_02415 [Rubrobacteraceae bacterium]
MSIPRYYTLGAIVPDIQALLNLEDRLVKESVAADAVTVLVRRRDESLVRATLPEAHVRRIESGLTRMQWFEFASTFIGVTAVSVLMGAVSLPLGITVQAIMMLIAIVGLIIYHRLPRLEKKVLGMGLPENLASQWEGGFSSGFALVLASVPAELFEDAQDAFLEDETLRVPLAVDRRPVL